jgi:hypothetical protein
MNLKKVGKLFTSKCVGPLSYKKIIYRAAVSQRLGNTGIVSPLKIKIPNKNMHEKPTNTPIIHSVY